MLLSVIFLNLSYRKYFIKDIDKQESQPVLQILEHNYDDSNTGGDLNEKRKSTDRGRNGKT